MASLSPLLKQATQVRAVRGEGVYLYDEDGRRFLDFTSGIGVTSTGHCHPAVVEAAQRQAGELIHGQYTTVLHPRLGELTERLGRVLPETLDSVFFASAGTEAVEAAVRLARQATGRANVIVFDGGFHGRTAGSLSLTTSKTAVRAGLQPLPAGVFVAPFPATYRYGWDEETTNQFCLDAFDRLLETQTAPRETAAVLLEPVLGEGGYIPANPAFLQGLRQRCSQHGMLLVLDEIQSGVARSGLFWAHEHYGAAPDILITAKGLASGFPLSAMAAPREIMEQGWPGSQGGTYGGNAVSCAAACATLQVIEDEHLVENANLMGSRLHAGLTALAEEHPAVGDVRGLGLMLGVEFRDVEEATQLVPAGDLAERVRRAAEDEGLLLLSCGPRGQVIRFIPPLIVRDEEVDEALRMFERALRAAA